MPYTQSASGTDMPLYKLLAVPCPVCMSELFAVMLIAIYVLWQLYCFLFVLMCDKWWRWMQYTQFVDGELIYGSLGHGSVFHWVSSSWITCLCDPLPRLIGIIKTICVRPRSRARDDNNSDYIQDAVGWDTQPGWVDDVSDHYREDVLR